MASGSTHAAQGHTAQTPVSQSFHGVLQLYCLCERSFWSCHLAESAKQIVCFFQNTACSTDTENSCGGEGGGPPDTLGRWRQAEVALTFRQEPQQEVGVRGQVLAFMRAQAWGWAGAISFSHQG